MVYEKITCESKKILDSYIDKCKYLTSDYALPVMLTWEDLIEPEMAEKDNALFIRAVLHGNRVYFPPLTEKNFDKAIDTIIEETEQNNQPFKVILALKEQIDCLAPERFRFTTNRDYAEYLYLSQDLIELNGRKYHAKRNHIHKFNSLYSYEFRSFSKDDKNGIIEQLHQWAEFKEEPLVELNMVTFLLEHIDDMDIFADVITIDGKIAGTAIGECSNKDMGIVMYEKCDYRYEGIYAAINQMFAEKHFKNTKYINRQEDMGIAGLRKSKMSYKPTKLGYRYTIKLKKK